MSAEERNALIERLSAAPERARQVAREAEGKPRPAGEWTPNVIVGHMLYVEGDVWQARFRQMASEENPCWEFWEPDGIDWQGLYGARPVDEVLDEFTAARQASVAYLRDLSDEGWQREGTHRRWGRVNVADLCDQILKHDEAHLGQIGGTV